MPLSRWVEQGWVKLTEGATVDYRKVRAGALALRDEYGVTLNRVGYDPWNADETVQELQEAGLVMVPIRQTYMHLSPATKRLERSVVEHVMRHGGNPVLKWMASCLDVKRDTDGNVKPVKPDIDRAPARIDGMVVLVMALACWLRWGRKAERRAQGSTRVASARRHA